MVVVKFFVWLKLFMKSGIKSGIIVFIFWSKFFLLKLILWVCWVFIIFFVLFINVGIKCKVIDNINEILWIGNFIIWSGCSKYLIVFDNFNGVVVKVNNVDMKIIKIKW